MNRSSHAGGQAKRPSILYGPCQPSPLRMTFSELLDYLAETRPDAIAVVSHPQKRRLSFKQLRDRSVSLAKRLSQDSVKRGSLVGIILGNRLEYFEIFFACARLGAALVLLNYAYAEAEFLTLLKTIKPQTLFIPPGFAHFDYRKLLPNLAAGVPSIKRFVLLSDLSHEYRFDSTPPQSSEYNAYIMTGDAQYHDTPFPRVSTNDIVNVQFTSGSTGLPKPVALSHYNLINCGRFIAQQVRMRSEDRVCLPVPLFHSFGMIVGISTSMVAGSSLVLPHETFSAEKTLACIAKYACTAIYGVPTMFVMHMAHAHFNKTDRSSIRFGIMGGAAMAPDLLRRVTRDFPCPRIYTCWGMTEMSSLVTMMHETDSFEKQTRTAGRVFPNYMVKIVKPNTGEVLPWGTKGEIVAHGCGQMSEYLGNPEKTQESLRQHPEDLEPGGVCLEDGLSLRKWLHTGDEGYLDDDGYLVISGRIKDIIIRGGENISPMEIEARLVEHDAISQAAVVGVPDEKYGEELCAFVELNAGHAKPSDEALRMHVRATLARFKAARYFMWIGNGEGSILKTWPQTASGKVSKPELRLLLKDRQLS